MIECYVGPFRVSIVMRMPTVHFPSLGGTRTDRALRMAEHDFFCPGCNPVGKPKVLVVITDGNTNPKSEDLTIASKSMKVILLSFC